jgi:hypothetical protein
MRAGNRTKALIVTALSVVVLGSVFGLVWVGNAQAAPTLSASDHLAGPHYLPSAPFVTGGPGTNFGPDDLTSMPLHPGGPSLIWTEWQNGIDPNGTPAYPGGPSNSTVAGYNPVTGHLVRAISVPGHVDGVTADPALGAILVTSNEDANSAFYLIYPGPSKVVHFTYSPSLEVSGNGGTDSIAIWHGGIYVSHSNPNDTTQPTTYRIVLDWYAHVARAYPFDWNDQVALFEPAGTYGHMALTDPDSNYVMPSASPRYAGQLATISQADGRLIFATHPHSGHPLHLTQLNLTDNVSGNLPPIDGIVVATADEGTLYVVDAKGNSISALVTDGWPKGTVFVTEPNDNGNPLLGVLNLNTGHITPLGNTFVSPKGLLFVPDHDAHGHGWGWHYFEGVVSNLGFSELLRSVNAQSRSL